MKTLTILTILGAIVIFALCVTGLCAIFAAIYFWCLKCNNFDIEIDDQDFLDTFPYDEDWR